MRRTRAFARLATTFFACSLGLTPVFAAAQNRISANITNGTRTEIAGSVHPHARTGADLGPTAGDTKLSMSLRFSMSDAQSTALDQLLADQQNPASPRYRQWLTPTEFGAQFGLSDTDIAKATAWLTEQGFTVTGVGNGRTFVTFDGTVAQANAAFATNIHNVSSNGEAHFANISSVTLPGGLANVVGDITGLHNFRPHSHLGTVAHPQFTSSVSGNHYIAPGDFYAIYDMEPLLTAGYTGAGIGTGGNCHSINGLTCGDIAVTAEVDLYNNNSDVTAFRSAAGLNASTLPTTVHPVIGSTIEDPGQAQNCNTCSPNTGDLQESSLDVEWSGGMAPGASILFVSSACGTLPGGGCGADAMTWTIDNNLAPIVTTSYGNCEAGWGSTDLNAANLLFKQAAAQGQTILTSSADFGATDCDAAIPAIEGLTVDFPASSPYVTAMGGSMFNEGSATFGTQYWASPDGSFSAGSAVPAADVSAKGYIPEAVWNEDAIADALSASGGGVSAFFPKPAWQVETGAAGMTTTVPADASRDLPDLSLNAASGHDAMLFCVQGSCVSGFRQFTGGTLEVAGGTSFDSQAFGGMLALIEQKVGSRLGMINPVLYALGNNATYYNGGGTTVFHDITTGNNSSPCTEGKPNCPNGGNIGYTAATGYDLATGWGSVDLNNLASAWTQVTPLALGPVGSCAAQLTLTCAVSTTTLATTPACASGSNGVSYSPCTLSVATGSSVTLTATVTGGAGTPTGTVQFLDNNVALSTPVTLNSNGVATYTYNATCATLGQQQMTAVYSGSTTYAGSKGPALPSSEFIANTTQSLTNNGSINTNPLIVTVTSSSCPDFSVTPGGNSTATATIIPTGSNATVFVNSGGTIPPVTITVAPLNGFTGTVSFTTSVVSNTGYTPTVTFNPSSLTFTSSSSAAQTTSVSFSGIIADLSAPPAPGRERPAGSAWYGAGSGVAIAGLMMVLLPCRRRLGGLLLAVLAISAVAGVSGCSSSSSTTTGTGSSTTNPYAGTYTVTMIATYSSGGQTDTHSSVITYAIN